MKTEMYLREPGQIGGSCHTEAIAAKANERKMFYIRSALCIQ